MRPSSKDDDAKKKKKKSGRCVPACVMVTVPERTESARRRAVPGQNRVGRVCMTCEAHVRATCSALRLCIERMCGRLSAQKRRECYNSVNSGDHLVFHQRFSHCQGGVRVVREHSITRHPVWVRTHMMADQQMAKAARKSRRNRLMIPTLKIVKPNARSIISYFEI